MARPQVRRREESAQDGRLVAEANIRNLTPDTLNVQAQKVAESSLVGKCGAAVAWNPQTGAVLAMASSPTYNPNQIEKPNGYQKILSAKSTALNSALALLTVSSYSRPGSLS